jgi:hypothetical protein
VWLQDLEKKLPLEANNTYVGTDMRALFFPEKSSPAMTFSIQDITEPWPEDWKNTFDLVHQRSTLPAVGKKRSPPAIKGLAGLLKPGGWIQLVEPDHTVVEGPAARAFAELLDEVFAANNTELDIARRMEDWLREAGLQNVECKVFDVPMGVKNPNKEMQPKSARFNVLSLNGMIQVAKRKQILSQLEEYIELTITIDLPVSFSPETLESLPSQMQEELSSQGGILRLYCVWGQKPSV